MRSKEEQKTKPLEELRLRHLDVTDLARPIGFTRWAAVLVTPGLEDALAPTRIETEAGFDGYDARLYEVLWTAHSELALNPASTTLQFTVALDRSRDPYGKHAAREDQRVQVVVHHEVAPPAAVIGLPGD